MTCIVGLVDNGNVFIGGDSAGVAGTDIAVRRDKKVFRNGPYLMGFTTSFRMGQILRYRFHAPSPAADEDLEAFMATTFVDALRNALHDGGFAKNNAGEESGGTFIVGIRGRLFEIQSDYQVAENVCGYSAVGCGDNLALGSLHTTSRLQGHLSPRTRVKLALEAAAAHSAGVCAPFTLIDTEDR